MTIGFRSKLLFSIAAITTVFTLAISMVFFHRSAAMVEENYIKSLSDSMSIYLQAFDETMIEAYYTAVQLSSSEELLYLVDRYTAAETQAEKTEYALAISAYLKKGQPDGGLIDSIYLYLPQKKQVLCSTEYHAVREIFYPERYDWLLSVHGERARRQVFSPLVFSDAISREPRQVLTYTKGVYRPGTDSYIGELAVNVNERALYYQLLDRLNRTPGTQFYLLQANGVVASAKQTALSGQPLALPDRQALHFGQTVDIMRFQANGTKELGVSVQAPYTQFRMLCLTDYSILTDSLRRQQTFITLLLLCALALMLVPAALMSKWLYQPVKALRDTMQKASEGDLSARAPIYKKDEIGALSIGFNEMVARIEGLIGELVEERMQKKEAELEALQYQITPHFMYNTLNSIKFAALLQGADKIGEQLGAFIELLQASISKKGAFVQLQDEVRLLKNYVTLQQFRYMDSLHVEYEIDPLAECCYVPRLLLQPLVENAILHGLDTKTEKCSIHISALLVMHDLVLTVQDNGKGMDEAQIHTLMHSSTQKGHFSGIGVANIRERLQLYYADKAALRFTSDGKSGTKVTILMPASGDAEEYKI